jgi:hypothetical protein
MNVMSSHHHNNKMAKVRASTLVSASPKKARLTLTRLDSSVRDSGRIRPGNIQVKNKSNMSIIIRPALQVPHLPSYNYFRKEAGQIML